MIYVGTCGFSYRDWIGPFYPDGTKGRDMLALYSRRFAAVEIDSSYYGVPARTTVAGMNAHTPSAFRFSFKLPQTVTHPRDRSQMHDDAALMRDNLAPLVESGKLACVLAQFPHGFKPERETVTYLKRVIGAFEELPVVVEFRNAAWQSSETIELLRAAGAGFSNVDMPKLEGLLTPSSDVTSPVGYVRFHGRNSAQWWRGTNVTRYAYEYTVEELVPWTDRIAEIEAQASDTFVFFNNHAAGRAATNAEAIEMLLDDRYGDAAATVVAHPPPAPPPKAKRQLGLFADLDA
ncbi:MAG TPA: DUF72 domain-containing protein [Candidatus Tumulicola sp.]